MRGGPMRWGGVLALVVATTVGAARAQEPGSTTGGQPGASRPADLAGRLMLAALGQTALPEPELRLGGFALVAALVESADDAQDSVRTIVEDGDWLATLRRRVAEEPDPRVAAAGARVVATLERWVGLETMRTAPRVVPSADESAIDWQPHAGLPQWLSYVPVAGKEIELRVRGCDSMAVTVFDPETARVRERGTLGSETPYVLPAGEPATESVAVRLGSAEFCTGADFALALREPPRPLPPARSVAEAVLVEPGQRYRGEVGTDESTWLRFAAGPGVEYEIVTSRLTGGLDSKIALHEADETLLAENDDGGGIGLASRLTSLSLVGGSRYVRVWGLGTTSGGFEVVVRETRRLEVDRVAVASAGEPEAGEIAPDGRIVGVQFRETADRALLSAETTRGAAYRVRAPSGVVLRGLSGDRAVLVSSTPADTEGLRESTWQTLRDGVHVLELRRPDTSDVAMVSMTRVETAEPLPETAVLSSDALGAPPMASGEGGGRVLVRVDPSQKAYARIDTSAPVDVVLESQTLTAGGQLLVAVKQRADDGTTGEAVTTTGDYLGDVSPPLDVVRRLRWHSAAAGAFLVELENLSASPLTALVSIERTQPYDGLQVGDIVVLGRHRDIPGHGDNWAEEMQQYVGREATITEQAETEYDSGAYLVKVDVDNGTYVWRTRDLRKVRGKTP